MLAACEARPQLAAAYLADPPFGLEPRASTKWMAAITLTSRLIRIGAGSHTLLAWTAASPSSGSGAAATAAAASAARVVFPAVLNRGAITRALAADSAPLVRYAALLALLACLRAMGEVMDATQAALQGSGLTTGAQTSSWLQFREALRDAARDALPDPQTLVALIVSDGSAPVEEAQQPQAQRGSAKTKRAAAVDDDNEDENGAAAQAEMIEYAPAPSDMRTQAMSTLASFRRLVPGAFAPGGAVSRLDPTRLLPSAMTMQSVWEQVHQRAESEVEAALDVMLAFTLGSHHESADGEDNDDVDEEVMDDMGASIYSGSGSSRDTAPGHIVMLATLVQHADETATGSAVARAAARLLRLRCVAAGATCPAPSLSIEEAQAAHWVQHLPPASCPGSAAVTSFFAEAVAMCARRTASTAHQQLQEGVAPALGQLAAACLESALRVGSSTKRSFVDRLAVSCYVACVITTLMAACAPENIGNVAAAICACLESLDEHGAVTSMVAAHADGGVTPMAPLVALRRTVHRLGSHEEAASDAHRWSLRTLEAAIKAYHDAKKSTAAADDDSSAAQVAEASGVVLATLHLVPAQELNQASHRTVSRAMAAVGEPMVMWAMSALSHVPLVDAAQGNSDKGLLQRIAHSPYVSFSALLPAFARATCRIDEGAHGALCSAATRVPWSRRPGAVRASLCWLAHTENASAAAVILAACNALILDGASAADGPLGNKKGGQRRINWSAAHTALAHPWLCDRYMRPSTDASEMDLNAALDEGTTALVARICSSHKASTAAAADPGVSVQAAVLSAVHVYACRAIHALVDSAGVESTGALLLQSLASAARALFHQASPDLQRAALKQLLSDRGRTSDVRHYLGADLAERAIVASQESADSLAEAAVTWQALCAAASAHPGSHAEEVAMRVAVVWPHTTAACSTAALFAACVTNPMAYGGCASRAAAALCASSAAHGMTLCAGVAAMDDAEWHRVALALLPALTCVLQAAVAAQCDQHADVRTVATRMQSLLVSYFREPSKDVMMDADDTHDDALSRDALRHHAQAALIASLALAPPEKDERHALVDTLLPSGPKGWYQATTTHSSSAHATPAEICKLACALARGEGALKKAKAMRVRLLCVAMATATHIWQSNDSDAAALPDDVASLEVAVIDALKTHVRWIDRDPKAVTASLIDFSRAALRCRCASPAICELVTAAVTQFSSAVEPAAGEWIDGFRQIVDDCFSSSDSTLMRCLRDPDAVPPQIPPSVRRCAVPLQSLLPLVDVVDGAVTEEKEGVKEETRCQVARDRKRAAAATLAALLDASGAAPAQGWTPGGSTSLPGGVSTLARTLVSSYHATCDLADVELLRVVRHLDAGLLATSGYLWGPAAEYAHRVGSHAVSADLVGIALREINPPDARRAGLAALAVVRQTPDSATCTFAYDATVVLPATAQWLATGAMSVRDACAHGLLPLALAALASQQDSIRSAAYAVLAAAVDALQQRAHNDSDAGGNTTAGATLFREQPQVGALLLAVRNAVSSPLAVFPASSALFAAEAAFAALHPDAALYSHINRFVLKAEALDVECLPLVNHLLHSGDADTWKADGVAACRLVRGYIVTPGDGDLARRAFLVESLMAVVTSPMTDAPTAREALAALTTCLGVGSYAVHAVDHSGIITWLKQLVDCVSQDLTRASVAAHALSHVLMAHPGVRLRAGDALVGIFSDAAASIARAAKAVGCSAVFAPAAVCMYRHLVACRAEVQAQRCDGRESEIAVMMPTLLSLPALFALVQCISPGAGSGARLVLDTLHLVTDTAPPLEMQTRCGPSHADEAAAFAGIVAWSVGATASVDEHDVHTMRHELLVWSATWLDQRSLVNALGPAAHQVAMHLLRLHSALPPHMRHAPRTMSSLVSSVHALLDSAAGIPDTFLEVMAAVSQAESSQFPLPAQRQAAALSALRSLWCGASMPADAMEALLRLAPSSLASTGKRKRGGDAQSDAA